MSVQFEYFYGSQAEQFSFYRIPKVLLTDEAFTDISVEAKVLYSFMLDRMSLSVKNCWFDDDNRVYIIYTIDDILIDFGCARQKALKLLDELEKGIGLIERKRQGLGRPNIIYVKNFIHNPKEKRYENQTSANMKIELQEVPKSYANNTYNNKTNYNDTEKSYTERNDTEITSYPINRVNCNTSPSSVGKGIDTMRWIEKRQTYEKIIKNNIDYDIIVNNYSKAWLDEIVAVMVDVVCSDEPTIRINKQEYPHEVVKSRFLKINSTHIEYIDMALRSNTSDVRNIRAFLITTIYRSFETADNWFSAKVQYDMANK